MPASRREAGPGAKGPQSAAALPGEWGAAAGQQEGPWGIPQFAKELRSSGPCSAPDRGRLGF
jgi:hypothetical protein